MSRLKRMVEGHRPFKLQLTTRAPRSVAFPFRIVDRKRKPVAYCYTDTVARFITQALNGNLESQLK